MFRGSRFCAQCGAEATREILEDGPPIPCPRCTSDMQSLRLGSTLATECAECGGLWLDARTLQRLCSEREQHAAILSTLMGHTPRATGSAETVRYVPCPRCGSLMNRVNFAKSSGVIMDACRTDGVWLDRGELQRVLGFIDAGGLETQRAREKEQLIEEQRRLVALQSISRVGAQPASLHAQMTLGSPRSRDRSETTFDSVLRDIAGFFTSF